MHVIETALPGVLIIEPKIFGDNRGYFYEGFNHQRYVDKGFPTTFVQDNFSRSHQNVLRGLHYQMLNPQGKLVWVNSGRVFDVAVDVRPQSPTYRQHVGVILDDTNHRQLYIPPGYAHGFCVLSETANFAYKCTDYYNPAGERGIRFDDPMLAIDWPCQQPILSAKDANNVFLHDIPHDQLPRFSS